MFKYVFKKNPFFYKGCEFLIFFNFVFYKYVFIFN